MVPLSRVGLALLGTLALGLPCLHYRMPSVRGNELARRMLEEDPALVVVVLSGDRRAPLESRGVAMGAYTTCLDLALGVAGPVLGAMAGHIGLSAVFLQPWCWVPPWSRAGC